MNPPSKDDVEKAFGAYHLHCLGDMLVWALTLAASEHPEQLREAFSKVFSSSAVEESARRALNVARQARAAADECRRYAQEAVELMAVVNKQLDEMERRIDGLGAELDRRAG